MNKEIDKISLRRNGSKQENRGINNPLIVILIAVLIPSIILMKFSGEGILGHELVLLISLSFPLSLGIYKYVITRKIDLFAAIGFLNVLLTGALGLLRATVLLFAIKESLLPAIMAISFFLSLKTGNPLITALILNDKNMNLDLIEERLNDKCLHDEFSRIISNTNLFFVGTFMLSAVLNFVLTLLVLKSPPNSEPFLEELGRMNLIAPAVIALPAVIISIIAMLYFLYATSQLINCPIEEITKKAQR